MAETERCSTGDCAEAKESWEQARLHVQVGDIITSKRGILTHSPLTDQYYLAFRLKYRGNGLWEARGNRREPIDVSPVPPGGKEP